jgi:quercetin dioxygenase-like cupin family protein
VLDGEVEITVLTNSGPAHLTLRAGSVFVVPRGAWHRPLARGMVTLLSATPTPTEIAFGSDPQSTS